MDEDGTVIGKYGTDRVGGGMFMRYGYGSDTAQIRLRYGSDTAQIWLRYGGCSRGFMSTFENAWC